MVCILNNADDLAPQTQAVEEKIFYRTECICSKANSRVLWKSSTYSNMPTYCLMLVFSMEMWLHFQEQGAAITELSNR